jgi:hypothetical protein
MGDRPAWGDAKTSAEVLERTYEHIRTYFGVLKPVEAKALLKGSNSFFLVGFDWRV